MRPRVFFDTNIILDLIQERTGYDAAAQILQKQEDGDIDVCLSMLSLANVAYVLRKTLPHTLVSPILKQISSVMEVLPMDNVQFQQALLLSGRDFEDIMQLTCAIAGGCTIIITHDPRDFHVGKGLAEDFQMPEILTPEEYIAIT